MTELETLANGLKISLRLSFRHAAPEKTEEHDCRRRIAEPSAMGEQVQPANVAAGLTAA
jgi:hypothetical protein